MDRNGKRKGIRKGKTKRRRTRKGEGKEKEKESDKKKNLIEPVNPNAVTLYRSVALKAFLFSEMTRRVIN